MTSPGATDGSDLARLKALFFAVSDLQDDAARLAWLQAQGVPEALQARVMALVAEDADSTRDRTRDHERDPGHDGRTDGPVASTAVGRVVAGAWADVLAPDAAARWHEAASLAWAGQRLGPWRLLSPLGSGGMGQVFLAERADGLYQREVAIKLLRGRAHPTALALLARERQILATLAHPHIARLLDGGTTPDGQPYLVMERVHGQRIDHWCAARPAPLAQRLALFDQVCDAVGEAHRRGVVHCDLKPANVLVTEDAQAMLLDFGVARLQQKNGGGDGTAAGDADDDTPDVIGLTPSYASPEQRAGLAATPASDIYSLGRLLQVLLADLPDAQQPRGLRRRELQALLDCAQAEQPGDRYRHIGELQDDLSRWHRHEPLQAMPAGWSYRAGKLLRRQWPWALAGSAALALVAGFTVQLAQERDRALQAEALARLEAATARQAADFVVGLFEGADPAQSGQADIGARVLVDRGRERVDSELADQPALRARLQGVLGQVYQQMGRPAESMPLLEAALAAEQRLPRPGLRREEASLHLRLAMARANAQEPARAEASARQALALLAAAQTREDRLARADAADVLGYVLTELSRFDEARPLLDTALAERRALLGPSHVQVARTLHHLGMLHNARGDLPEGERVFRESLEMKRSLLRPLHPSNMNTMQTLAQNLTRQGRSPEAIGLLEDILRQREALFGTDSTDVLITLNELGNALQDAGRTVEAIARYRQSLAVAERVHGRDHIALTPTINNLGTALEDAEQPEAEAVLRRSLALRQAHLPAGDLALARAEHNLARWLLRRGRADAARPLVESAATVREAALPADHADRVNSTLQRAELALAQGRPDAAAAALAPLGAPPSRPAQRLAWHRLQARMALARGQPGEVRVHLQAAEALVPRVWPEPHPARLAWSVQRLALAAEAGDIATAGAQLKALSPRLAALPPGSPTRQLAEAWRRRLEAASPAGAMAPAVPKSAETSAMPRPPGTNPKS